MTIVQRGFPSAEIRDLHEVGLPDAFDRINRVLRARAQSSPEPERGGPHERYPSYESNPGYVPKM
jgi:hypothetical protein